MKEYEVFVERDVLELVAFIRANSYEEAQEWARARYGKYCRVEESWEG